MPVRVRFSTPVQTGPGAHPASCTMGTGSFPGVKSGRGVTFTTHTLLLLWSRKSTATPLFPLWAVQPVQSLSACTRVHFTFAIYFYTLYNITYFFHPLWTLLYITSQKTEETNNFQYKYTFMIRTTYVEFQTSTTFIPQGYLTSDCEIKQLIWQWKAKEDCSSNVDPCVIFIIWMTVATT